ncbi:hypothetical protein BKA93DRAFT_695613, partial [Sparassis latifolia]
EWSMRMEAELIQKKLWYDIVEINVDSDDKGLEVVEEEYAKKKAKRSGQKMAEARAEMIRKVED